MKAQRNWGGEGAQEKISRDRENNSSVSQLGKNNLRKAHLQPLFTICVLTHCHPGASCGWLKNIFHHRSLVVKKNKVENGWHQIVSMIYHFSLVTKNQPYSGRLEQRKRQINISDMNELFEVNLESFFRVYFKKSERKNNNPVISHGKVQGSRI